jgi:hypothetical protein
VIDSHWQEVVDVELTFVLASILTSILAAVEHLPGRSSSSVSLVRIIFLTVHTSQLYLAGCIIDLLCDSACIGYTAERCRIAFCGRGRLCMLFFQVDDLVYLLF